MKDKLNKIVTKIDSIPDQTADRMTWVFMGLTIGALICWDLWMCGYF